MSYQAYLDGIEEKTGLTPQQLLDIAAEKGFTATTKAGDVLAWLAEDYDIGKGYGMAFFGVLKNGPMISEKHVGTDGVHRDESSELRLDGKANR